MTLVEVVDTSSTLAFASVAIRAEGFVDVRRDAPEPWASAMAARDYVHAGSPSIRALGRAARAASGGDSPSDAAVHKIVMGEVEQPEDDTVNALAKALHVDVRVVAGWVGAAREQRTPWTPPDGADRLTRKQRDVLDALVRVMIDTEGRDGDGNAAPTKRAGRAGADVRVADEREEGVPITAPKSDRSARPQRKRRPAGDPGSA